MATARKHARPTPANESALAALRVRAEQAEGHAASLKQEIAEKDASAAADRKAFADGIAGAITKLNDLRREKEAADNRRALDAARATNIAELDAQEIARMRHELRRAGADIAALTRRVAELSAYRERREIEDTLANARNPLAAGSATHGA